MCLPFKGIMPHGGERVYKGKPVKGSWDGKRYIIRIGRYKKTFKVARLICEAFHGLPKDEQVCMHLDENSRNNKPENLAWGSQKQNLNAPNFVNYCKTRTGENNPLTKGQKKKDEAQ